jgi:hypothetical protein
MSPRGVELCRTREDYRALFASQAAAIGHEQVSFVAIEQANDPCIHRSDKRIDEHACRCIHKATFACASPSRGVPTCKVADCAACEHYE